MTSTSKSRPTRSPRTFFGHPVGLSTLSGVEMWERFSFYGLQAILAYYLYYSVSDGGLGIEQSTAVSIIGAYGGLVYLTSVAGAWVADRVLSAERTLLFSAVLVMIGHISLAVIPGIAGVATGLVCIAVGSGAVKTTSQVILGSLYSAEDNRRDGGFSIYYMAVNTGALIGPLITNALWGWKGFHLGFAAAAVMMGVGLIQYVFTRGRTLPAASRVVKDPLPARTYVLTIGAVTSVVAIAAALFAIGIISVDSLSTLTGLIVAAVAVMLWAQMYRSDLVTATERRRLVGFVPMFIASVGFWSIFQQQFTVIAVYADQRLNRSILGVEVPPGVVQSINPLMIIIFAGVFATVWSRLGERQPSYPAKFAAAMIIIAVATLVFLPFVGRAENSTPFMVIVGILLLFTLAELLLSPVGNSLATRVAPQAFPTRMFALWLLSVSLGTTLSGSLARFYDPSSASGERVYFLSLCASSLLIGLVLFVARGWIHRSLTADAPAGSPRVL
ncbi:peptide MFS transporter [Corynebacterium kalidii]